MTLQEYYKFPEGSNCTQKYVPHWLVNNSNFPCPSDMSSAFREYKGKYIPHLDTSKVTNMNDLFNSCTNINSLDSISNWDTSNVIEMRYLFSGCSKLESIDLSSWDTSNVTAMNGLFSNCNKLISIDLSQWDTSKVTIMSDMISYCNKLTSFGAINCSGITTKNKYVFTNYSNNTVLTNLGGFIGMKMSWDEAYGLAKVPNLTYESCINILNGLYDFTGNGETPNSNQGVLKVNANFLTTVGDDISIGTNKGWTINA